MDRIVPLNRWQDRRDGTLICPAPWEFRKAFRRSSHFVQMPKDLSAALERDRRREGRNGQEGRWIPHGIHLTGGPAHTIRAVFSLREDEKKMRDAYYLTGLVDCAINRVNPVLRTDLLRDMYKKILGLKTGLGIHWHGPLDQVLLPLEGRLFNEDDYRTRLMKARTLKELYRTIRRETERMFDILSVEYVFYRPGTGG